MPTLRFANRLTALVSRLLRDRNGNIAVIFALAMVPTVYLLGMTLDYTQAVHKRSQLNAAVDAAVIAAVTPAMMAQSTSVVTTTATNVFNATANNLPGLAGPAQLTLNITNQGLVRSVTGSYTAASTNNFPILLGSAAWPIGGTSAASASGAPNINFFLLLDDSPSMAIAGTPAGVTTMVNNTSSQGGCAFACHETDAADIRTLGNAGGVDNYALARNLGVTLRIDLMAQAAANLMSTAATTQAKNNNTYKVAIYTFDYGYNTIFAPSGLPSANLTSAATAAAGIQMMQVYDNDCLTSSNCNQDTDTNFSSALQTLNITMPAPGGGTSTAGDTPQEVVFIVTDGVEDKVVSSPSACSKPTVSMGSSQYRCQQPFDTTWCTTVKNRGIRIAVLYTEYLPLPTNSWYNQYVEPFNGSNPSTGQIATGLQSCASSGLFYDVQSGGDITAALNALFQLVVQTAAHLTQ
jgi:Flp pilus assembly protein TadG